jgi:signal transduction histidine kinase
LSNLVSNAIKYTHQGSVSLSAEMQPDALVIRVADTGPGLSTADFAAACGRNVRLAGAAMAASGEGLGLAIAQELAVRHGLKLRVLSDGGPGTAIEVIIPHGAARDAVEARPKAAAH